MESSKGFTSSRERYSDFRSTALIFTFFGVIGLIYTILCITNHAGKYKFFNNSFQYIIASIMFGSFIVIGIITHFQAKSIGSGISKEEDEIEQINNYLKENLTNEYIKANSSDSSDVEQYFEIVEKMTNDAKNEFPEISDNLISNCVETYYNNNF